MNRTDITDPEHEGAAGVADPNQCAIAQALNRPITVRLSTGQAVALYGVPLDASLRIEASKEAMRFAMQQYMHFQAAALDPNLRLWEAGNRLPAWNYRWLRTMRRACLTILSESLIRRRGGLLAPVRRYLARRKARHVLHTATVEDWALILGNYEALHDINAISEAMFGPERPSTKPSALPGQKKSPEQSGPTPCSESSRTSESPSSKSTDS